jgi:hypothetical protein
MALRLVEAAKNAAADAVAALIDYISLADGPASTDEIAVTRQGVTWTGADNGIAPMVGTEAFADVPAGADVAFVQFWSADTDGTYYGCVPAGSLAPVPFTAEADTDVFTADEHGLTDGLTVVVFDTLGAVLPTGLTEGTIYFVRDATTDTFKLALTSGGDAVAISADGAGFVQTVTVEHFTAAGTYTVSALSLDMNL